MRSTGGISTIMSIEQPGPRPMSNQRKSLAAGQDSAAGSGGTEPAAKRTRSGGGGDRVRQLGGVRKAACVRFC
jgi:hypothetical protein